MVSKAKNEIAEVLIIGGGPTGLSLALGLSRNGVRSILLEKKNTISQYSRAPVIHQRSREILKQWGVEDSFLDKGNLLQKIDVRSPANEKILLSADFRILKDEAEMPGVLVIRQSETEQLLLEAVKKTGMCDLQFGTEPVELEEKGGYVQVKARSSKGEEVIRARYCVGCDGASGFVRNSLGLDFKGKTYPVRTVLADVRITDGRNDSSWPRFHNAPGEVTIGIRLQHQLWRLIHLETDKKEREKNFSRKETQEWVEQVLGPGNFETLWLSPFDIHRRSSPSFRKGRILLAGDAAHIHSPAGGQGMNAGIQDSHNLAWKLAAVLAGGNPGPLLDSYETERRGAVIKQVSAYTDLVTRAFLQAPLFIRKSSFFLLKSAIRIPLLQKKFLKRIAMTEIKYRGSELLPNIGGPAGRRLPNVILQTPEGREQRLYELLPQGIAVLSVNIEQQLETGMPVIRIDPLHYRDQSGVIRKRYKIMKGWVVVRPDRHIAWAGNDPEEMQQAISRNLGRFV